MLKNKRRKKRTFVILSLIVLLAIWIYWSNVSIQVTEINVENDDIPESFSGFKIVQVSDLHNAQFGGGQSRLTEKIKAADPDIIAVTGDLIDSRHTDIDTAMEFINAAVKIAPVYYVTGNHESRLDDYPELKKQLTEAGVTLLQDESVPLERGGESIELLGLNDPGFKIKNNYKNISEITDSSLKNISTDSNTYTVLMSHRPDLINVYSDNNIDLVLCGHAHGGQFRLPFIGGIYAPGQGFFPEYTSGSYTQDNTTIIVSRGLGNSIFPFRVNNNPELVVITLE